ncbi:hypothetical protein ACN4EE_23025 [Geminocystis sp. CENA526]
MILKSKLFYPSQANQPQSSVKFYTPNPQILQLIKSVKSTQK